MTIPLSINLAKKSAKENSLSNSPSSSSYFSSSSLAPSSPNSSVSSSNSNSSSGSSSAPSSTSSSSLSSSSSSQEPSLLPSSFEIVPNDDISSPLPAGTYKFGVSVSVTGLLIQWSLVSDSTEISANLTDVNESIVTLTVSEVISKNVSITLKASLADTKKIVSKEIELAFYNNDAEIDSSTYPGLSDLYCTVNGATEFDLKRGEQYRVDVNFISAKDKTFVFTSSTYASFQWLMGSLPTSSIQAAITPMTHTLFLLRLQLGKRLSSKRVSKKME